MSILQWNCRGYRANSREVLSLLTNLGPAYAGLQESMLGQFIPRSPTAYSVITYSQAAQGTPGDGLMCFISNNRASQRIAIQTPLQAVAIRIQLHRLITICNIYVPPRLPLLVYDLVQLSRQLPPPYLIIGDFNARNPLWGDTTYNQHGEVVEQFLTEADLCLLNTGAGTRFCSRSGESSVLDLSLCSPDIVLDLGWRVMDDLHGSDHFPIIIDILPCPPVHRTPRYLYDKADWEVFRQLTQVPSDNNQTCNLPIAQMIEKLTSLIRAAANCAIPKTQGTRNRPNPWWTPACTQANLERKRALRRFQRSGLVADKIAYSRARAVARRVKKDARSESWRRYVSGINADTPPSKVWNRIKKMTGRYSTQPSPFLMYNGEPVTEPRACAELLVDHFASVSSRERHTPAFRRHRDRMEACPLDFSSNDPQPYNEPITMMEVKGMLKCSRQTAPGADQVTYHMIQHLHETSLEWLLHIYNRIWMGDLFPDAWRQAVTLAFLKPGKPASETSSYRPIALTSCLCKLLERIVNVRLTNYLEHEEQLSPQ